MNIVKKFIEKINIKRDCPKWQEDVEALVQIEELQTTQVAHILVDLGLKIVPEVVHEADHVAEATQGIMTIQIMTIKAVTRVEAAVEDEVEVVVEAQVQEVDQEVPLEEVVVVGDAQRIKCNV